MPAFILRRLFQAALVLLAVALISFALFRFVGDPVNQIVGVEASAADRAQIREELGLNDPVVLQFARFAMRAAQLDFGMSYQFRQPVSELLISRFPATLELAIVSMILAIGVGIPMGVYTALYRDSLLSKAFQALSLAGISLPTFLIGILMIYVFSVLLGLFPSYGRGDVVDLGWWTTGLLTRSGWAAIFMPAVTLAMFQMTLIMRIVRAEMLEVLRTDYIKFAKARGLPARIVNFGHALRNTMVPVITIIGLELGSVIAFAIITESVFQWPGMGLLFLNAVQNADIPIMAGYLILISVIFVVINLMVDLLYVQVDPRLKSSIQKD